MLRRSAALCLLLIAFLPLTAAATDQEEALRTAASANDLETVRQLIAAGVDVNAANDYGGTALSFAADKGHLEVVKVLVENGANVNQRDTFYQESALGWAAYNGHAPVVLYLLEQGAEGGADALGTAIYRSNFDLVQRIIEHGKLSAKDLSSALFAGQRMEESEERSRILALLEAAGAKPPPRSEFEIAPEILAAYAGTYRVAGTEVEGTLAVHEGGLQATFPGSPPLQLEALDDTTFQPQGSTSGTKIVFQVAESRVTGFEIRRTEGEPTRFERVEPSAGEAEAEIAEAPAAPEKTEPEAEAPVETAAESVKPAPTSPHWPAFRGANAAGVAEGHPVPTTWNVEDGTNVRWQVEIPGRAHSSPIIWGDRLFLTTAISSAGEEAFRHGLYGDVDVAHNQARHVWRIYALDKRSGEILWQRDAHQGVPQADNHIKATQANATPVTDGKNVVAVLGSEGLYCYDLDGTLRWQRDLGRLDVGWFYDPSYQWGHGSSPIIYENRVIVQADRNRDAFIAAYDLKDGHEIWRTARENLPSWGTPTVFAGAGRVDLVTNGSKWIRAYDPRNGAERWRLAPTAEVSVGTPVVGHGLVFVTARYTPVQPIYAIRPGGEGDLSLPEGAESSDHVAWRNMTAGTYIPTPIVYGEYFYTNHMNGALTCYRATSGERVYRERLGGRAGAFTASPVAADGKLYLSSENDGVYVVKAGPEYELLATNPIGEVVMATPAISDGMLYVRSLGHLYGIGEPPAGEEGGAATTP